MTLTSGAIAISSWGWLNDEGQPVSRSEATFRMWSVRDNDSRVAFLAMPIDTEDADVLRAASALASETLSAF